MDYLNVSIQKVQKMPYDLYLFFRREAFIHLNSQTKEGREYLKNAWRISQTAPDRKALKEKSKGGPRNAW